MSSKNSEFDVIVVGGGLSGLVVASGLSQNQKVVLIEKNEFPGGLCRPTTGYKDLSGHFHTIPFSSEAERSLDFLELLIGAPVRREKLEQHPIIFEQGFKPFVGFGDSAPLCVEELQYYLSPQRLYLHSGPEEWIHALFERFKGEFINFGQVTRLLIENNRCVGLTINGQKQVMAKNIVFCCNPKELLDLVRVEFLPPKARQKLSKSLLWTSIMIQLVHGETINDSSVVHLLNHKSEANLFALGQFFSPIKLEDGSQQQSSQWLSFISEYDSDDEELLGQAVKRMKKLIQKAFPSVFSHIKYEKISVNPHSHGSIHINLEESTQLNGIENLYLVSPFSSELKNIPGSLQQAENCLRGLGYRSAP